MAEAAYHFQSVLGAAAAEDGSCIQLDVLGAAGQCGLMIPATEVPSALDAILVAWGEAVRRSGDKTMRRFEVRKLAVYEPPGSEDVSLLVTLHSDAPPLVLGLTRTQLLQFATGILETAGLVSTPHSGSSQ